MSIPPPTKKRDVLSDPSEDFLQKWKELFNSIDPEHIHAYKKGDPEFPREYNMEMDKSRLEDACNLNVQLFIKIKPVEYLNYYGNEIYCCLQDDSFASGWIKEFDENMDTVEKVTWEKMYSQIVDRKNQYTKRIPPPPIK
jgi:hypothetical protein